MIFRSQTHTVSSGKDDDDDDGASTIRCRPRRIQPAPFLNAVNEQHRAGNVLQARRASVVVIYRVVLLYTLADVTLFRSYSLAEPVYITSFVQSIELCAVSMWSFMLRSSASSATLPLSASKSLELESARYSAQGERIVLRVSFLHRDGTEAEGN